MKKTIYIITTLFSVMFIAFGCQNEEQTNDNKNSVGTLEDDAGNEVEIPENPERIIGSYLEDDLLALDEPPVVQWSVNDGESIQNYLQDEGLEGLETIPHDLPYEVVASHEPDLILMSTSDFAEGESYENYSAIAPTFVVEAANYDNWRDRLRRVAEVLDEEELAEEKITEYEEKSQAASENMPEDEEAIALWWTGDNYFVSNADKSSGEVLYNDLGLEAPGFVEELSEDDETPWIEVSLETLAESDVEHIFFVGTNEGDSEVAFEEDAFQNIPAIEEGNVYEYTDESSWQYSGFIANSLIVDDVEEALNDE